MSRRAAFSSDAAKCATPLLEAWAVAPPSSSKETSSPVTALITSGPVMNMFEVPFAMTMKSVIAGLYTAPPAQGPRIALICGRSEEHTSELQSRPHLVCRLLLDKKIFFSEQT